MGPLSSGRSPLQGSRAENTRMVRDGQPDQRVTKLLPTVGGTSSRKRRWKRVWDRTPLPALLSSRCCRQSDKSVRPTRALNYTQFMLRGPAARNTLLALGLLFFNILTSAAIKPNLVLITLESTRADRIGFLGGKSGTTPNLDKLAAESLVFEHAYAQAPGT